MVENFLLTIYGKMQDKSSLGASSAKKEIVDKQFTIENKLVNDIKAEVSEKAYDFIAGNIDLKNYSNILLTTNDNAHVENVDFDNLKVVINTKRINHLKNINTHLASVNKLLPDAGIYIGRAETYALRKIKFYKKYGEKVGLFVWFLDFFFNRVVPKIKFLDKCYYYITKGKFHSLSLAELLGRLVYNGFDIIDYKQIEGYTYFTTIKTKEPSTHTNPTYHPIIKLQRIGKNEELVGIYKMRTMHPYSEYLQDFVVKLNGYNEYGKPAKDFRLTRWGKFFRKFWIDEIPQFVNLIKGDLAIVGVRPLSKSRYRELPNNIQCRRIKYKPGLIPPYVALNMPDSKANIMAEEIYLNDREKHPLTTNIRYFIMALYNILTRKIESS